MLNAGIKKALCNKEIFNAKSLSCTLFARSPKKEPGSFLKKAAGAFLAGVAAVALFHSAAFAAPQVIDGAELTTWPGSRKVFYHQGYGRTWVFYQNVKGFAYQSFNGSSWSTEGIAVSTTEAGGDVNTVFGSVYYVAASSAVYVIANDGAADGTGNSIYLRYGDLNSDGSITWAGLQTRTITGSVGGATTGDCLAGANVGIALTGTVASGNLHWTCDA